MSAILQKFKSGGDSCITKTIEEALAQECYGMAPESRLQITPWGIDLTAIKQQITMYHAREYEMVPFAAAQEMARSLPNCDFRELTATGDNVHIDSVSAALKEVLEWYKTSRK